MKNIAVIFAGGVGSRMGSKIPKQFLEIYGKPIIVNSGYRCIKLNKAIGGAKNSQHLVG